MLKDKNKNKNSKKLDKSIKLRPSPSEHASDKKNEIVEGNDGNSWLSSPDKNNVYHWKKLKGMFQTKTAEEFYDQYPQKPDKFNYKPIVQKLDRIRNELYKDHIYLFAIGWKNVGNFVDDASDDINNIYLQKIPYVKELVKNNIDPFSKVSTLFYTEHRLYWSAKNGVLNLHHDIRGNHKQIVTDALKKHFGKKFSYTTNRKTIDIKLPSLK